MATVEKPRIKDVDYDKLTPAGRLFLDHRRSISGAFDITEIDLRCYPNGNLGLCHDDLKFPVVVMRSKIPLGERMRKYGLQGVTPNCDSGRRAPDGSPIPTEEYIASTVRCYGKIRDTRRVDLAPYASRVLRGRMSLEEAVNAAGEEILHLMEGEFEIVEEKRGRNPFGRELTIDGEADRDEKRGSGTSATTD